MVTKFAALIIALRLTSCGSSKPDEVTVKPAPKPVPEDAEFQKVQPLIAENCGGCHGKTQAPAFTSAAAFKTEKVKKRLSEGTMPPAPKKIADDVKATLLAYLGK